MPRSEGRAGARKWTFQEKVRQRRYPARVREREHGQILSRYQNKQWVYSAQAVTSYCVWVWEFVYCFELVGLLYEQLCKILKKSVEKFYIKPNLMAFPFFDFVSFFRYFRSGACFGLKIASKLNGKS